MNKIFKLAYRSSYLQAKTNTITDCESKFFRLTEQIKDSKFEGNWEKTQSLIDTRYKLFTDCMDKLTTLDKNLMDKLKEQK